MANPLQLFSSFGTPGVFVVEDNAGYIPASLASHNQCYMLGFSTLATAPKNSPRYVTSPEDFANVFGNGVNTQSYKSVELFFNQRCGVGLYFVNVASWKSRTLTLASVTVGTTYSVSVNGTAIAYTAVTGDTASTVLTQLATRVNEQAYGAAWMPAAGTSIRYDTATIAASAGITLGTETVAAAYPVLNDVIASLNNSFTAEDLQGYLIAPEFFEALTTQADRQALQRAMDTFCADPSFQWVALVDCGVSVATVTNPGEAVLAARTERNGFASPRGHSAYFFPHLINSSNVRVPCSAAIAGIAIKRNRTEGFKEPPAGTRFPINGVTGVSVKVNSILQEQLNPQQINCVRWLPKDGIVSWGARSLSTNPYYRFINTRVILNVLIGTLRGSFNSFVFSAVDGLGALFGRLAGTASQICERLRKAGALYGASPSDAYLVVCDETNNPGSQLEDGVVSLDVYVKPAPTLEILGIRVIRTAIGQSFEELVETATQADEGNVDIEAV